MFVYQILVRENESSSIWVCLVPTSVLNEWEEQMAFPEKLLQNVNQWELKGCYQKFFMTQNCFKKNEENKMIKLTWNTKRRQNKRWVFLTRRNNEQILSVVSINTSRVSCDKNISICRGWLNLHINTSQHVTASISLFV